MLRVRHAFVQVYEKGNGRADARRKLAEKQDAMPKGRRKRPRASERASCAILGCENDGFAIPCCKKHLCAACQLQLVRACCCEAQPRFFLKCPLCRANCEATLQLVKHCMATSCPSHARLVDCCDEQDAAVIVNRPCDCGSYECADAELIVRTLT